MSRTALYRHYDAEGRLLYVGITDCLSARDKQHREVAAWHKDVVRSETQWCVSRQHAAALERVAIRFERPVYNVALANSQQLPVEAQEFCGIAKEIEDASERLGLAPSTICERAGQGGRFYARLKSGARCWPGTAAKVRAWIAEQSEGASQ